jgi:hypothetical protein
MLVSFTTPPPPPETNTSCSTAIPLQTNTVYTAFPGGDVYYSITPTNTGFGLTGALSTPGAGPVTATVFSNCNDPTSSLGSFTLSGDPSPDCRNQAHCLPLLAGCSSCGSKGSLSFPGAPPGTYWVQVSAGLGAAYSLSY